MALLRIMASGADFEVAPFFGPEMSGDKKRSSLQNEWVFGPKVCEDQKKGLRR